MKILVLGSGGMLGHLTTIYLKEQGHDVSDLSFPYAAFEKSFVCDISNLSQFESYLQSNNFDMIINCIALLIQASDQNKDKSIFINSYFPHWLEGKFKDSKTKIIQVSTDGVFGDGITPFDENSPHLNSSFYAKTKSLGELDNGKDLTIRSSYFGPDINENGKGLLNWFFSQNGEVNGYTKAIFTGVSSLEFAKFVHEYGSSTTGIYNLGATKPICKYDLLNNFIKDLNIHKIKLVPNDTVEIDTSVISCRNDIKYKPVSYETMVSDLCDFIINHKSYYRHYNFI